MWFRKNKDLFQMVESNNTVFTVLLVVFLVSYFLFIQIAYGTVVASVLSFFLRFIMIGISGILGWILFRNLHLNSKFDGLLAWLGKNSLPIYLLHYFFLPSFVFEKEVVDLMDVVLLFVIANMISLIVMIIASITFKILKISKFLDRIVFGNI